MKTKRVWFGESPGKSTKPQVKMFSCLALNYSVTLREIPHVNFSKSEFTEQEQTVGKM